MARYAVLTDIHGNLEALEAVLAHADGQRVDAVWCLGDIVVYGPDPDRCLSRLRQAIGAWPGNVIIGNNDDAVKARIEPDKVLDDWIAQESEVLHLDEKRQGYRDATTACHRWTLERLTEESRELLEKLPKGPCPVLENAVLVHASPCDPVGRDGNYLTNTMQAEEAFWCMKEQGYQFCLFGHTHMTTLFRETTDERPYDNCEMLRRDRLTGEQVPLGDRRVLINPGSVGQSRDGDSRAAYVVVDTDEAWVEFYRVDYAMSETLRKLKASGLPDAAVRVLCERLHTAS